MIYISAQPAILIGKSAQIRGKRSKISRGLDMLSFRVAFGLTDSLRRQSKKSGSWNPTKPLPFLHLVMHPAGVKPTTFGFGGHTFT